MSKRTSLLAIIVIALLLVLAGYLVSRLREQARTQTVDFRPIAELATAEYAGVAEITNERVSDDIRRHLGVREEVLMLVYGTVKAGFDLTRAPEDSVWVDRDRVQVVLPPPQILSASVDTRRTRVVTQSHSFLLAPDAGMVDEAIDLGIESLRQEALDAGLLDRAREQGRSLVENYLKQLGFREVRVIAQ